jgi:ubiquinone/menaquinone biosynthesis C-methylase UbiE
MSGTGRADDDAKVAACWESNASGWTKLARMGFDVYRDLINTPAFLEMLPDVRGLRGLDVGCGEGHNTRQVAKRGAIMTAIDIAPTFIRHASEMEAAEPLGIRYHLATAQRIPFADGSFDFAMATMSLMDVAQPERAVREISRVLKPGGFFQFSISHPCFDTPYRRNVRDANGKEMYIEVAGYFDGMDGRIDEWIFSASTAEAREGVKKFRTPRFHRTISSWLNLLIEAGLTIEHLHEPYADEELAKRRPEVADTRVVGYFLHIRCRKL